MKKIRDWGFPIALVLGWVIASAYTVASLVEANAQHQIQRTASAVRT
ncbi:MAG TPA: hypothetical protein VE620_09800 [Myxococcales bacterium]|jgi:hypothetical protein|nr:hypothetical protein [Myxococcales bacterium]